MSTRSTAVNGDRRPLSPPPPRVSATANGDHHNRRPRPPPPPLSVAANGDHRNYNRPLPPPPPLANGDHRNHQPPTPPPLPSATNNGDHHNHPPRTPPPPLSATANGDHHNHGPPTPPPPLSATNNGDHHNHPPRTPPPPLSVTAKGDHRPLPPSPPLNGDHQRPLPPSPPLSANGDHHRPLPPPPSRHQPLYPPSSSSSSASFKGCCCWLLLLFSFLALLLITAALVIVFAVKPKKPQFDLQQVGVQYRGIDPVSNPAAFADAAASTAAAATLSLDIRLLFMAVNPNKVGIKYSESRFTVMYKGIPLGEASVPPFYQEQHSSRQVEANIAVDRVNLLQADAADIVREASLNDRVELRVLGYIGAKIRVLDFDSPGVQVSVDCGIVISPRKQSLTYKQCGFDGLSV